MRPVTTNIDVWQNACGKIKNQIIAKQANT